jgi:hypothetical protein
VEIQETDCSISKRAKPIASSHLFMKIEPSSGLSSTFVSFMDEYVLLCAATHSDTVVTSGAMSANTPVVTTEIRFSTSRALGIFVSCE